MMKMPTFGDLIDYVEGNYTRKKSRYSLELVERFTAVRNLDRDTLVKTLKGLGVHDDLDVITNISVGISRRATVPIKLTANQRSDQSFGECSDRLPEPNVNRANTAAPKI